MKSGCGADRRGAARCAGHLLATRWRASSANSNAPRRRLLSAYVQPVIDGYLDRFEASWRRRASRGHFSVMQSNGGRLPAAAMRSNAITALVQRTGRRRGWRDHGRRRARLAESHHLRHGRHLDRRLPGAGWRPSLASETEIDGLPIRTPVLDIVSVGAGGGSIGVDRRWRHAAGRPAQRRRRSGAGLLRHGRHGSPPRPMRMSCVGTIRPARFSAAPCSLDADRAHARLRADGARASVSASSRPPLRRCRLAVANIVRAIQLVSTERGRDPRDYALVPFGGAGPLLAARHRRGARHLRDRGAAQCRRHLGARPDRRRTTPSSRASRAETDARRRRSAQMSAGRIFDGMRERDSRRSSPDMKLPGDLSYTHTPTCASSARPSRSRRARSAAGCDSLDRDLSRRAVRRRASPHCMHGGEPGRRVEIVEAALRRIRRSAHALPESRPARCLARARARQPPRIVHGEA